MTDLFKGNKPCENCPYRKDAPVKHWHIGEFAKLLRYDKDNFAPTYMCHKNNGCICIGWLIDQDNRRLPNLNLRMSLQRHGITREYLDSLSSPYPMYESIREMIQANFPELLKHIK
jgi:hypothetical protein